MRRLTEILLAVLVVAAGLSAQGPARRVLSFLLLILVLPLAAPVALAEAARRN